MNKGRSGPNCCPHRALSRSAFPTTPRASTSPHARRMRLTARLLQSGNSSAELAKTAAKLVHPATVARINPFQRPIPAWLRNFQTFQPTRLILVPRDIFASTVRLDIMHRVVHWYRASLRAGTASSKHRSDVRGSTRKIRKQKGTGRARAGSSRAPHRRGGASCFGPKPRSYYYTLPKGILRLGLRSALSAKFKDGRLTFISTASLALPSHKTQELNRMVQGMRAKKITILDAGIPPRNLELASRVLKTVNIINIRKVPLNAYHVLNSHLILVTERARDHLTETLAY